MHQNDKQPAKTPPASTASEGLSFLEAFKAGRPMRRRSNWPSHPEWLHLGDDGGYPKRAVWRRIDTGGNVGLDKEDYLANDWQVMP